MPSLATEMIEMIGTHSGLQLGRAASINEGFDKGCPAENSERINYISFFYANMHTG